jgi:hypothetical protein
MDGSAERHNEEGKDIVWSIKPGRVTFGIFYFILFIN